MPGIEDALDRLGVPFCVASSGDHEKMRTTLGITGLLPRFAGRIFSVTQVARGKPAPDVYLFAARQLGAEPSACVVVEDTPPGVQAGVAAGMTVFGFCAHTPEHKLRAAGAHRTFDDLRALAGDDEGLRACDVSTDPPATSPRGVLCRGPAAQSRTHSYA